MVLCHLQPATWSWVSGIGVELVACCLKSEYFRWKVLSWECERLQLLLLLCGWKWRDFWWFQTVSRHQSLIISYWFIYFSILGFLLTSWRWPVSRIDTSSSKFELSKIIGITISSVKSLMLADIHTLVLLYCIADHQFPVWQNVPCRGVRQQGLGRQL